MDTVIRGGTIVTASDQYVADIGIEDGIITQIGRDLLGDVVVEGRAARAASRRRPRPAHR